MSAVAKGHVVQHHFTSGKCYAETKTKEKKKLIKLFIPIVALNNAQNIGS